MKKEIKIVLWLLVVAGVVLLTLVSNHSVEEIHWLKNNFYPDSFTMEDAKNFAIVEVAKIFFIALPVLTIIFICLHILKNHK